MDTPRAQWARRSAAMREERFSARTFDARGELTPRALAELREALELHGGLHVQRTGLGSLEELLPRLASLGFSEAERFDAGGRASEAVQQKWVAPGLRRLDYYPPELYLLPNNEVQYQRTSPARVLFFCRAPAPSGGRAFLHSAARVEEHLRRAGSVGELLLAKLERHGLTLETSFLHRESPSQRGNYFQSWQERFGTEDLAAALARARARPDEYDRCEPFADPADPSHTALRTALTLPAFAHDARGERFLRFPRLALDAPAPHNGYRRFPLGNGEELTEPERALLYEAYFATREGTALHAGDLLLFDNVRFGHSRESFEGARELYVAMAGAVRAGSTPGVLPPRSVPRYAERSAAEHYTLPRAQLAFERSYSVRTLDLGGECTPASFALARAELERHGAVHLRNTGLRCEHPGLLPDAALEALGFGESEAFPWGGMRSGRTARRALSRALRATDDYPPERWLLPHNEVLYQREMPARLLFFSAEGGAAARGGRTFVHSAELLERCLVEHGEEGRALLSALRAHGLRIEMGFLDERHPERQRNYFRSWQERFDTEDRAQALARCLASKLQFDEAWWREEPYGEGSVAHTLMTRIRIPAFCMHPATGRSLLLFPRIALDAPSLRNGHRVFPLGNGEELTDRQRDLLLDAFLRTREGVHYEPGDLLLLDNLRYGHSREAYEGPRTLGVAMAGRVFSDDVPLEERA